MKIWKIKKYNPKKDPTNYNPNPTWYILGKKFLYKPRHKTHSRFFLDFARFLSDPSNNRNPQMNNTRNCKWLNTKPQTASDS